MPVEKFKSKYAYRKWNAYRHMHGIPAPGLKVAVIAGKPHKVQHSKLSEGLTEAQGRARRKKDAGRPFKTESHSYDWRKRTRKSH